MISGIPLLLGLGTRIWAPILGDWLWSYCRAVTLTMGADIPRAAFLRRSKQREVKSSSSTPWASTFVTGCRYEGLRMPKVFSTVHDPSPSSTQIVGV